MIPLSVYSTPGPGLDTGRLDQDVRSALPLVQLRGLNCGRRRHAADTGYAMERTAWRAAQSEVKAGDAD